MTLALVLATCTMTMAQAQGRLKGKITDDSGETVPFANVIIEKGGTQVGGASSDFDGNYDINPIPPGTYTLKASCVGYNAYVVNNIVIPANKITYYDIKMVGGSISLDAVIVVDYEIPLISKDNTTSGESVTAEEIAKLPVRSAEGVAASVGGVFSADGEVGSIRGSREGAVYYIDGVRVIGNGSVPQGAIDQVDVILGGTPAQYGDAAGGIINMTTKGPSRTWGGGIEYVICHTYFRQHSQLLLAIIDLQGQVFSRDVGFQYRHSLIIRALSIKKSRQNITKYDKNRQAKKPCFTVFRR